ncbi:hypothetical protein P5V15_001262 [Pogonomyrmex californicus]
MTKKVLRSSIIRTTRNVFRQRKQRTMAKNKRRSNAILVERRAVRLLSRRYTLTATGYKYLEIGINVELILSLETWKGLYEQRWNIYKLLLNDYKDNFISVGPLTVRICLMNDVILVRLEALNVRVTMIESTSNLI